MIWLAMTRRRGGEPQTRWLLSLEVSAAESPSATGQLEREVDEGNWETASEVVDLVPGRRVLDIEAFQGRCRLVVRRDGSSDVHPVPPHPPREGEAR